MFFIEKCWGENVENIGEKLHDVGGLGNDFLDNDTKFIGNKRKRAIRVSSKLKTLCVKGHDQ